MSEVTVKEILDRYSQEVKGQVAGKVTVTDPTIQHDLNVLRALQTSSEWRKNNRGELFELAAMITRVSLYIRGGKVEENSTQPPPTPNPPKVTEPEKPKPITVPNDIAVFTSTDRKEGEFSYKRRDASSLYDSQTSPMIKGLMAGVRSPARLGALVRSESLKPYYTEDGKLRNNPQRAGSLSDPKTCQDVYDKDSEVLIFLGDQNNKFETVAYQKNIERLKQQFEKTGAHVRLVFAPSAEQYAAEMDALQKRISENGRRNFTVILNGHGSTTEAETGSFWAQKNIGEVAMRTSAGGHPKTEFDISEDEFMERMRTIQKATSAHGFVFVSSCYSGAFLA